MGVNKEIMGNMENTIIGGVNATIDIHNGLLITRLNNNLDNRMLLSRLEETVYIEEDVHELYSYEKMVDEAVHADSEIDDKYYAKFNYEINGVIIEKTIVMLKKDNTTVINYDIHNSYKSVKLRVDTFINNKAVDDITKKHDFKCMQKSIHEGVEIGFDINDIKLYLKSDKAYYTEIGRWRTALFHGVDCYTGVECKEDSYMAGYFEIYLAPKEDISFNIIASTTKNITGEAVTIKK